MKYTLLILLLTASWYSHAQTVVVANTRFNMLYIGENNHLKVAASNTPCSDIKLVMDSSKIESTDNPCEYNVIVYKPGTAILQVYNNRTGELIGEEQESVHFFSEKLRISIGSAASGGTLNLKVLPYLKGVSVRMPNVDIAHGYVVHSYTISILRGGQQIYYKENNGVYFDDEIQTVFKALQPKDKIFIYDVIIEKNDNKQPYADPCIITVM